MDFIYKHNGKIYCSNWETTTQEHIEQFTDSPFIYFFNINDEDESKIEILKTWQGQMLIFREKER